MLEWDGAAVWDEVELDGGRDEVVVASILQLCLFEAESGGNQWADDVKAAMSGRSEAMFDTSGARKKITTREEG